MISRSNRIVKNLTARMVVVLLSTLVSCIDDNTDNCSVNLSLRFEYTLNDSREDLFAAQVTHLELYLYDKDGYYIATYKLLQSELENGNTFLLSLPAGSYTFVVWANMPDNAYECTYAPKLEDVWLELTTPPSAEADPVHGSLFHGMATIILNTATAGKPQIIALTKNTNLVHILLEETENSYPLQIGDYSVHISGSNKSYKFDNTTVGSNLLHYKSHYTLVDAHTMRSDHTLLRLLADDDMNIQIRDAQGEVIYDEDLTAKIMESPTYSNDEDLDRSDEFTLTYRIVKTGDEWIVNLTSINDWAVTGQGGELN